MIRQVWLITGSSTGFGLSIVHQLLTQGYQVAATTRSQSRLLNNLKLSNTPNISNLLVLEVNLTNDVEIKNAIDSTITHFGQLDVVVNNAGYGHIGPIEEFTRELLREQFEINVFAMHSFIKYSLPHFRSRRNGFYLTLSSLAAFCPEPVLGIYAASKAAMTAMTEALVEECSTFGIKATSVEPGSFNTNFFGACVVTDERIEEYETIHHVIDSVRINRKVQPGDPDKAVKLFIELANDPNPPKRLFVGKMACDIATKKMKQIAEDMKVWEDRSISTDFAE
jgi:NAD(P)-dependent dehydrogenase (short-subunit alcohol dehydrogenase family)